MRDSKMEYRINGFDQIKEFYSWSFNNQDKVTPQHISLYLFLINQNNRNNWVEWFKCPYDLGMAGSAIGNKKTYYKCLNDLMEWKFVKYEHGINNFKAPLIKIEVLKCTSTDTATDTSTIPTSEPQLKPLPIPLPTHIYKHITNNLKQITDNEKEFIEAIKRLGSKNKRNIHSIEEIKNYFSENGYTESSAVKFFEYYNCADWKDSKGMTVKSWKQKAQAVWFKDENKITVEKPKQKLFENDLNSLRINPYPTYANNK